MAVFNEDFFNQILDLFDCRDGIGVKLAAYGLLDLFGKIKRQPEVLAAHRLGRLENCVGDLVIVVRNQFAVALSDGGDHD